MLAYSYLEGWTDVEVGKKVDRNGWISKVDYTTMIGADVDGVGVEGKWIGVRGWTEVEVEDVERNEWRIIKWRIMQTLRGVINGCGSGENDSQVVETDVGSDIDSEGCRGRWKGRRWGGRDGGIEGGDRNLEGSE